MNPPESLPFFATGLYRISDEITGHRRLSLGSAEFGIIRQILVIFGFDRFFPGLELEFLVLILKSNALKGIYRRTMRKTK